jgi:HK97 family phage major capsid protein
MKMEQMLMDKRKNLELQGREILDRAESENRGLSAEETRTFDRISGEMDALRVQSDRIVKFAAETKTLDTALRDVGHRGPDQAGDGVDVTAQFRRLSSGETRHIEFQATRDETRLLTEHRALSKGTSSAGGYTVPTMLSKLYEHLVESSTLISGGATIFNTNGGENLDVPVTTTHGAAALVAEAGTIAQSDPVFNKRTLGSFKYGELILVPTELLQDTGVDLEGYLARMAGRAVGNALGAHLVTGTGSGQPSGLFLNSTLGVTSGTGVAGAPTFDNLIDLFYSVIPPYRKSPEAAWLVKDSTAGALRKLKDSQNRYLWESSLIAGQPDMILGKPVYTDPNVAATAVNAKSVAFGDLSAYWVRLVNNIRFERSDDFKFDTDVVAFRCLIRGDGMLVDQSGAVKHFVGAAT